MVFFYYGTDSVKVGRNVNNISGIKNVIYVRGDNPVLRLTIVKNAIRKTFKMKRIFVQTI